MFKLNQNWSQNFKVMLKTLKSWFYLMHTSDKMKKKLSYKKQDKIFYLGWS